MAGRGRGRGRSQDAPIKETSDSDFFDKVAMSLALKEEGVVTDAEKKSCEETENTEDVVTEQEEKKPDLGIGRGRGRGRGTGFNSLGQAPRLTEFLPSPTPAPAPTPVPEEKIKNENNGTTPPSPEPEPVSKPETPVQMVSVEEVKTESAKAMQSRPGPAEPEKKSDVGRGRGRGQGNPLGQLPKLSEFFPVPAPTPIPPEKIENKDDGIEPPSPEPEPVSKPETPAQTVLVEEVKTESAKAMGGPGPAEPEPEKKPDLVRGRGRGRGAAILQAQQKFEEVNVPAPIPVPDESEGEDGSESPPPPPEPLEVSGEETKAVAEPSCSPRVQTISLEGMEYEKIVKDARARKGVAQIMRDLRQAVADPDNSDPLILFIPELPHSTFNIPYKHEFFPGSEAKSIDFEDYTGRDDNFHQLSVSGGWIEGKGTDLVVMDLLTHCVDLMTKPDYKAYSLTRLPIPEVEELKKPKTSLCHVIRSKDPSDFHVILLENQEWFDVKECNRKWTSFFLSRELKFAQDCPWNKNLTKKDFIVPVQENFCFQSPSELYQGLKLILAAFIKHVRDPGDLNLRDQLENVLRFISYHIGDLVVIEKPEERGANGYRGVIIRPVVIWSKSELEDGQSVRRSGFLVYLLDTGETRVVSMDVLIPLPKAFIGFRPLAIHCSLANVIPEKGLEWSQSATSEFVEIVSEDGPFRVKFYPRKSYTPPEEFKESPELVYLDLMTNHEPYFVELKDREGLKDVGVNLISKDLANVNVYWDYPSLEEELQGPE